MRRALFMGLITASLWTTINLSPPRQSLAAPAVDAKIEAVWPHDEKGNPSPVDTAPFVNVEVYLFERGTLNPVPRSFPNRVILRWARNNPTYPAHDFTFPYVADIPGTAVGQRLMRTIDDKTFPVWIFEDVPIALPQPLTLGPNEKTYFLVEVEGADFRTNVWAHANDPNTDYPRQSAPKVFGSTNPNVVDARIQLVWPHDDRGNTRPVSEASLVNIGVDLVEHPDFPRMPTVGFDFNRSVFLLRSLNTGFLERVKAADQRVSVNNIFDVSHGAMTIDFPRWVFNDIDVSAARDPLNKYYFAVEVDGVKTHTTIWAHGADARTYFPQKDVPARSAAD